MSKLRLSGISVIAVLSILAIVSVTVASGDSNKR
jgi:hypothetical protein